MSLWIAVLAPVSALLGVVVGQYVASRRESSQWLRDQELKAFTALVYASRSMLWRGAEITAEDPPTRLRPNQPVRTAMFDLREALASVEMLTESKDVMRMCAELEDEFGNALYPFFQTLAGPPADDAPEVVRARQTLERFRVAAKTEIRSHRRRSL